MLPKGSGARSVLQASPSPHVGQKPHHRSPPFTLGASQEPPLPGGCKAKVIRRQHRGLLTFSAARKTAMEKKGSVQLVPVCATPAAAAASCGAELRHPSCEGITQNVSAGICFPHPCLEEHQAHPPASAVPTPQKALAGAMAQEGVPTGHLPCSPSHAPAVGAAGSRHGGRGSARAAPSPGAAIGKVREHSCEPETQACSGTSSP